VMCVRAAVRVLSEMSIVLEDWSTDRERNAKRLDKMLKRYTSRLRSMYEWAEREDLSRPMFLPQSFLQHVDAGQSPNVWVKELITSTTQRHDQARGQFRGVKRMREVFDELLLQEGQDREGEGEGEKADSPQQPTGVPAAKQGKKAERETMGQAAGPAEAAPPVEDGPERKREAEGGTEGVMQSR